MDIDGQEAERFDIRLAPNPAATIEQEALDVAGVTLEQVQSYQPMEDGYRQLVGILSKYVNKFDKRDKKYAGEIWATSWEEAECFIKQRASTEKAVGFIPKD